MARRNGVKALEKLVLLIDSEDEKVAIQASSAVLDRGYGKPAQSIEMTGSFETNRPEDLTDEQLAERIAGTRARIAELSGTGTSKTQGPQTTH